MIPATQFRVLRASTSVLGLGQAAFTAGHARQLGLFHACAQAPPSASSSARSPLTLAPAPSPVPRATRSKASSAAAAAPFSSTAVAAGSPQRSGLANSNTMHDSAADASAASPPAPAAANGVYYNEANPPATTRPPPLELPARSPHTSTFQHLLATGKAYLTFYKTGLGYLWSNFKLARAKQAQSAGAGGHPQPPLSRADLLLQVRVRHDMRLLPVFGLLLLVCGELTPLVVLLFPHLVPYTCRIPKQVDKLRRQTEARRHASFTDLNAKAQAGQVGPEALGPVYAHIARSLDLVSPLWDRLGSMVPASLARTRVHRRLQFLAEDDGLLRAAGGVAALEAEEVRLACADRGLDVLAVDETLLRGRLAEWLERTRAADRAASAVAEVAAGGGAGVDVGALAGATDAGVARRVELLARRPNEWPPK